VPLSAAAAVLFGQSHMRPLPVPVRRSRRARQARPRPGRDARRDRRSTAIAASRCARADALRCDALPLGLAQGARVTRRIAEGRLPHVRELRARRAAEHRAGAPRAGRMRARARLPA
jgi:predicted homoserine dehydrogenase-like protein